MKRTAFLLFLTISCAGHRQTGTPSVYAVSTAAEFVAALGSDRTIELVGNVYFLSEMADRVNPNKDVQFVREYVDNELHISNVKNLVIRGKEGQRPMVLTEPEYGNVLVFENSSGITLEHLSMGHGPPRGFCSGGVLRFVNSHGIRVRDCLLFGSGTEGIAAEKCSAIEVLNSQIERCTYNILTLDECRRVLFKKCSFSNNESQVSGLINLYDCDLVKFDGCKIEGNGNDYTRYLFELRGAPIVQVDGCAISGNTYFNLTNEPTALHLQKSSVSGNMQHDEDCCDEPH